MSLGLVLAACGGAEDASPIIEPPSAEPSPPAPKPKGDGAPLKAGLAEGMYGGPTGSPGAERYQYPLESEEGRAIAALRRLRRDGKAPDTLILQLLDFTRPRFEARFPGGAPSLVQLFEEETGIGIEFVETQPASEYTENLRNARTRNGSFDLVMLATEELGDFAEAGLLRPLDDLVVQYEPQWLDPVYGYAGGEPAVARLTRYRGSTYLVGFDADGQPYFYRGDLLDDPKEQADFEERYGRPLRFPLTWEEQAEVAEFFTRPNASPPLYGDVATLAPFWGIVNWQHRFVSSVSPNLRYFNEDGSANVNNEAGVRAFEELLRSLAWHPQKALEQDWFSQYQLMGAGSGWGGASFPNLTKQVAGNAELDTANVGRFIRTDVVPGRVVAGALVRRPAMFFTLALGVNAFADPSRHEAAYLFLQWAGGARIHTWLVPGPGILSDPHHAYSLDDPYVARDYGPQPIGQLKNIVPRTAPPITLKGAQAYRDSLSQELQKVLTRQQAPEQAATALQERWDAITEEQGVETQVAALETFFAGFPEIVDTPGRELPVEEPSTAVS